MSRLDAREGTLVNSAECASHRYQIFLRDELVRNQLILRKRRFHSADMLHKGGITDKPNNKVVRLWLAAECVKIIFNELSTLCR